MRQFYNEGMMAEYARQEKRKYDKELDYMIAKKKEKEDQEMNSRKE